MQCCDLLVLSLYLEGEGKIGFKCVCSSVPKLSRLHPKECRPASPHKYCQNRVRSIQCSLPRTFHVQRAIARFMSVHGGARAFHVEPVLVSSWSNLLHKEKPSFASHSFPSVSFV